MDAQKAVSEHAALEIGPDLALDEAGDGPPDRERSRKGSGSSRTTRWRSVFSGS